jgi:hypothetical protein
MQTAPPKGRELLLSDSGIHRAGYCSPAHESDQSGSSPVCLLVLLRVTGEILSAKGIHSMLRFADTDSVAIWVMAAVERAELITDQDAYGARLTEMAALRRIGGRFEFTHCPSPHRDECDPPCDCGDRCVIREAETEGNLTMPVRNSSFRTACTQNAWQDRPVTGDMIDARSGRTNPGGFVDRMGRPWLV